MKPSVCLATILLALTSAAGQQRFSAADYQRAEKLMGYNTTPLVLRSGVRPAWLPDERFWYRVSTAEGAEFVLVDPAKGTRGPAFDHGKMAAALSAASGRNYAAGSLPFQEIEFSADGQSVTVQAGGRAMEVRREGSEVRRGRRHRRCFRARRTGRARRPRRHRRRG